MGMTLDELQASIATLAEGQLDLVRAVSSIHAPSKAALIGQGGYDVNRCPAAA